MLYRDLTMPMPRLLCVDSTSHQGKDIAPEGC
jgi:hypothetical protein